MGAYWETIRGTWGMGVLQPFNQSAKNPSPPSPCKFQTPSPILIDLSPSHLFPIPINLVIFQSAVNLAFLLERGWRGFE